MEKLVRAFGITAKESSSDTFAKIKLLCFCMIGFPRIQTSGRSHRGDRDQRRIC